MSYTVSEAWAIIHETQRLLDEDARRGRRTVNVRASGAAVTTLSAADIYFGAIEAHLAAGMSVRQARRAVAIGQRPLLVNYLREHTASYQAGVIRERERAQGERARLRARAVR